MNRMFFIQKPPVNEIQSFTNSKYQEIINGQKIHDTNIESYRKNNDVLISGHIDNKPIYYNSRQKQNRLTPFRNKKQVSFSNFNSSNRHPPIIRDLTPFHLTIQPYSRNNSIHTRNIRKTTKNKGRTKKTKHRKKTLKKHKQKL